MADPDLSAAAAAARYRAERQQGETIAEGHESAWGWSGAAGVVRADDRAAFLTRAAGLGAGVRCLELGAGTGEFTHRLVRTGCELTALELSERTAELCRQRVGPDAEVVTGNAETGGGIEGRTFDAIVGVSVLHHLNLELCFAHTFVTLRPGGTFAFSEPNMANPQVWLERHVGIVKRLRRVTPHETAFRVAELRSRFERAGLVVTVCEPFDLLHPLTPAPLVPAVAAAGRALERTPVRHIAGSIRIAGFRPEG